MDRPDFPTMDQVEKADREQLAKWYRFLPSGDTPEQRKIQHRLAERFQKMGGMTPEFSKKIGFGASFPNRYELLSMMGLSKLASHH
jgi:hypothetical protein